MKKFILMTLLMMSISSVANTEKPLDKITQPVETALNKTTSSISKATTSISTTNKSFLNQTTDGVSTVYGDGKNGITTMYNDVKSLAPDAKSVMKEIYNTLKSTSLYAWNLLVRQQLIWSLCFLFCELVFFFTVYRFWTAYDKYATDLDESGMTKSKNIFPIIILGISSLILGYFSFIHFESMITGFFNPEFGALRQLVEMGKNFK